jgi:hypothetical protein
MFIYVAIDWRWFKFYPLEADVFIDVSGRSKKDRETFQQIQSYVRNHPEKKMSVFQIFYRDQKVIRPRITFAQVLSYNEIKILILCATFRNVSIMINIFFDDPEQHKKFLTE